MRISSSATKCTKGVHFCSALFEKLASKLPSILASEAVDTSGFDTVDTSGFDTVDTVDTLTITWALLTGCFSPWRRYFCYSYCIVIVIIIYYYYSKVRAFRPMRCTPPCPVETPVSRSPPAGFLCISCWGCSCCADVLGLMAWLHKLIIDILFR